MLAIGPNVAAKRAMRLLGTCLLVTVGFVGCGGDDELDVPAATPKDGSALEDAGSDDAGDAQTDASDDV